MRFVIAYDIPSTPDGDRRRARLARYLESVGLRIQFSLFEVELQPERMPIVWREIEDRLDMMCDSVRIYSLCANCSARTISLGQPAPCEHGDVICW